MAYTARKKQYASLAAHLKSELETVEGFVSVERFQSLTDPDKLLSLSFFRDENAVAAWRSLSAHGTGGRAGRRIFGLSFAGCAGCPELWAERPGRSTVR
ncbi:MULTISPECIES: antibiotic biosynthesis monooxygenase family protein [Asaia]|uniref:antibiotic biosynthesis monooxygenase family protein n=1 Tax=Asaia TaxID=91914 RepID=UPI000421D782